MTVVAHDRETLNVVRSKLDGTLALVPTMGALHDGHRANIRAAKAAADHVAVSVFVNPLQFGPNEDYDRYPRQLDDDVAICEAEGVDLVFAPDVETMYRPKGSRLTEVTLDAGPAGDQLEGASRPGFFDGVLTVVAKLFQLVKPQLAFFGEKDYQQLALVRRMVFDLDFDIRIVGVPTVREPDGLARSSRNVYLSTDEYDAALAIPRAIAAAQASSDPLAAAREVLLSAPGVEVDYLTIMDPNLGRTPDFGDARLLIAAFVGKTRLIDNAPVTIGTQ